MADNGVATVSVVSLAAIFAAAVYTTVGRVYRLAGFYVWKLAHRGQYVNVDNVVIYYETYGVGRPVPVLHGGLGSIEDMSHQIRALTESQFVIAVDSRGRGRSTDSNAPLSYSLM